jgi:ubiquinone/menaquinone biosynthesis C-methylase UbiE
VSGWKHKRSVKRRYDSTAEMYDERYMEEQEAKYRAALADVTVKRRVLDVGCGTGLFFRYVSPEAANVVGIDLSKNLLAKARERAKMLSNVDLVQADADHLPFEDDVFNAVFAFTVLQNMPLPLDTLREVHRTVRSGSAVVVTGLKKTFSTTALRRLVDDSGLKVLSVKSDEKLACHVLKAQKQP